MIRTGSVASFDDSSTMTGNSCQMAIEGQWDETISIHHIHEGIVQHLQEKLEKLKLRYMRLKTSSESKREHMMKKIVAARVLYQRYVNVTKDVLHHCNSFLKTRRDTPASRIAFIRNIQEYISQAREFVKMDISLRRLSPTLINYVQIKSTDSPQSYGRKREMCRILSLIVNDDKNSLSTNGVSKLFRSRYVQQSKIMSKGFPDIWIQYFPIVLRNSLCEVVDPERRWLITILYILSRHCSVNYIQQGYCSGCLFPLINERSQGMVGGKLYCMSCKKEIDWTYFINPRTICLILSSFHPDEIKDCKTMIIDNIRKDPELFDVDGIEGDEFFEEVLNDYLSNRSLDVEVKTREVKRRQPSSVTPPHVDPPTNSGLHEEPSETDSNGRTSEQLPSDSETTFPSIQSVMFLSNKTIKRIYGNDVVNDFKSVKESYYIYRNEIESLEGKCSDNIPRGLIPKIERYICHYYNLPLKEEIRKRPLDDKGEREGTTKKMILEALNELSLTKYSHLLSKIANKLWGSKLPDVSSHYNEIINDCVIQKEVFNRMSSKYGRKSNLNQRLILMFITQRYGYNFSEDNFRINFGSTTISKHIEILKELFSIIDSSQ